MTRRKKPHQPVPAPTSAVGNRIIAGLTELRDTLRNGIPLQQRFIVRTAHVPEPEAFSPKRIRELRTQLGVSQVMLARLLGVSAVLVQSWEQSARQPSPLARRLLAEIERNPRRWRRMITPASRVSTAPQRKSA